MLDNQVTLDAGVEAFEELKALVELKKLLPRAEGVVKYVQQQYHMDGKMLVVCERDELVESLRGNVRDTLYMPERNAPDPHARENARVYVTTYRDALGWKCPPVREIVLAELPGIGEKNDYARLMQTLGRAVRMDRDMPVVTPLVMGTFDRMILEALRSHDRQGVLA